MASCHSLQILASGKGVGQKEDEFLEFRCILLWLVLMGELREHRIIFLFEVLRFFFFLTITYKRF